MPKEIDREERMALWQKERGDDIYIDQTNSGMYLIDSNHNNIFMFNTSESDFTSSSWQLRNKLMNDDSNVKFSNHLFYFPSPNNEKNAKLYLKTHNPRVIQFR